MSNWRFSVLPNGSCTCIQLEPGSELPALQSPIWANWAMDSQWSPCRQSQTGQFNPQPAATSRRVTGEDILQWMTVKDTAHDNSDAQHVHSYLCTFHRRSDRQTKRQAEKKTDRRSLYYSNCEASALVTFSPADVAPIPASLPPHTPHPSDCQSN